MDTALICGETEKFWPRFPSAARLFPRSGVDAIPTGSGRSRWPSVQVNEARSQLELAHHNKLVAKFSRNILIQFCRCLALRTWFYVNGYVLVSWEWMGKKKQDAGAIASCPCFCVGFEKRICHHQMISIFRFPLCPLLPLRRPIFRKFPKKANPAQNLIRLHLHSQPRSSPGSISVALRTRFSLLLSLDHGTKQNVDLVAHRIFRRASSSVRKRTILFFSDKDFRFDLFVRCRDFRLI